MKSGFYLLYGILTSLYLALLSALPAAWRDNTAAVFIFSDPAAMGLFFMGAIVLLEKSQRMPCAYAVSPVRTYEYIAAKVVSLSVIELIVAALLTIAAGKGHLPDALLGTALAGAMFTLAGIILATKITSLNQFILWTVPIEIIGSVPAVLHLFGISPGEFRLYPANVCMDMIAGRRITPAGLFAVMAVIIGLSAAAGKSVSKMWRTAGGIKI